MVCTPKALDNLARRKHAGKQILPEAPTLKGLHRLLTPQVSLVVIDLVLLQELPELLLKIESIEPSLTVGLLPRSAHSRHMHCPGLLHCVPLALTSVRAARSCGQDEHPSGVAPPGTPPVCAPSATPSSNSRLKLEVSAARM